MFGRCGKSRCKIYNLTAIALQQHNWQMIINPFQSHMHEAVLSHVTKIRAPHTVLYLYASVTCSGDSHPLLQSTLPSMHNIYVAQVWSVGVPIRANTNIKLMLPIWQKEQKVGSFSSYSTILYVSVDTMVQNSRSGHFCVDNNNNNHRCIQLPLQIYHHCGG